MASSKALRFDGISKLLAKDKLTALTLQKLDDAFEVEDEDEDEEEEDEEIDEYDDADVDVTGEN